MSRSLRRFQKRVARARKVRILVQRWGLKGWHHRPHLWRPIGELVMNEPGWWVREFVTRPARVRSRHLCQLVKIGRADPEGANWPDYRRPHVYYW